MNAERVLRDLLDCRRIASDHCHETTQRLCTPIQLGAHLLDDLLILLSAVRPAPRRTLVGHHGEESVEVREGDIAKANIDLLAPNSLERIPLAIADNVAALLRLRFEIVRRGSKLALVFFALCDHALEGGLPLLRPRETECRDPLLQFRQQCRIRFRHLAILDALGVDHEGLRTLALICDERLQLTEVRFDGFRQHRNVRLDNRLKHDTYLLVWLLFSDCDSYRVLHNISAHG